MFFDVFECLFANFMQMYLCHYATHFFRIHPGVTITIDIQIFETSNIYPTAKETHKPVTFKMIENKVCSIQEILCYM